MSTGYFCLVSHLHQQDVSNFFCLCYRCASMLPHLHFPGDASRSLKLIKDEWKPDFGPDQFVARWGATVTGVRKFLIAYNINVLGTKEQAHRYATIATCNVPSDNFDRISPNVKCVIWNGARHKPVPIWQPPNKSVCHHFKGKKVQEVLFFKLNLKKPAVKATFK